MASKFLRVKCECGEERIVFNRASMAVKCEKCEKVLLKPKCGKAFVTSKVIETLE
jgi:ribosomal protein S27E